MSDHPVSKPKGSKTVSKRSRISRDERDAYHEAGHFVVQLALGGELMVEVSIEPRSDTAGRVSGEDPRVSPSPTTEQVEAEVISFYAGYEAERKFDPALRETAWATAQSDFEKAAYWLRFLGDPDGNREASLRRRAHEVVKEHWGEIEKLAKELIKHRTVSGFYAELVVEVVQGNQDESVLARYRQLPGVRG